jgi:hypothetical protein
MDGQVNSKHVKYQSARFDGRTNYGLDLFVNAEPRVPNNFEDNVHHIVYDNAGAGKEYIMDNLHIGKHDMVQ